MSVMAGFFCSVYYINFGMYLAFVIYYGKVKMARLSYYYFWSTNPPTIAKILIYSQGILTYRTGRPHI